MNLFLSLIVAIFTVSLAIIIFVDGHCLTRNCEMMPKTWYLVLVAFGISALFLLVKLIKFLL